MERNTDAARERLARALGRHERPLARGDDGRLVEIGASRLEHVDLRDVAVCVDREGEHDVSVLACLARGRRVLRVHVREHRRRRHVLVRRRARRRARMLVRRLLRERLRLPEQGSRDPQSQAKSVRNCSLHRMRN